MKRTSKKILPLFIIFFLVVIYFVYLSLTDYRPEEIWELSIYNNQVKNLQKYQPLKIATFNIGFASLDKSQDSYKKVGNNTKAKSKEKVKKNLDGIVDIVDQIDPDFILIQELDIDSGRSYRINQLSFFEEKYPNFSYAYGDNYRLNYLLGPTGKVESGLATFSKYNSSKAFRFSLPGQQDGIQKYFDYDRAIIEKRFELQNGDELILINLHLSNFNEAGIQRFEELNFLQKHINEEYEKGSYIIVGGDWNHSLPNTDPNRYRSSEQRPSWLKDFPEELELNGFNWAIDDYTPTFRSLTSPYLSGRNFKAVTDGFLVSDNIQILNIETLDYRFNNSYHNPVVLDFVLK